MKIGFRNTAVVGGVVALGGALILALIGLESAIYLLAVGSVTIGFALGLISLPMIVGAQSVVDWGAAAW